MPNLLIDRQKFDRPKLPTVRQGELIAREDIFDAVANVADAWDKVGADEMLCSGGGQH